MLSIGRSGVSQRWLPQDCTDADPSHSKAGSIGPQEGPEMGYGDLGERKSNLTLLGGDTEPDPWRTEKTWGQNTGERVPWDEETARGKAGGRVDGLCLSNSM